MLSITNVLHFLSLNKENIWQTFLYEIHKHVCKKTVHIFTCVLNWYDFITSIKHVNLCDINKLYSKTQRDAKYLMINSCVFQCIVHSIWVNCASEHLIWLDEDR
jgi:hypothetical protein